MASCPAAKILVGITVAEWDNKDLSKFLKEWDDDDSLPNVWKMYELNETKLNLSLLNPAEYEGFEEDVVIGIEVLEVYSQPAELNIEELLVKIENVKSEFMKHFGFEGKVYWAGDYY